MSKFGVPTEAQLAKINKHSRRPLTADEVFVYPHKMAGDMIIPERHIQLTKPLLEMFVKNANAGVAFLLDHSWSWSSKIPALSYGRVFEGQLSQDGLVEGETISFNGNTYIVRGKEKNGISTDAIISDIETGVMIDTSIGWGANKFECSICGNDIRDLRKCDHYLGKLYIVNEETGETKLCYAMAKPPGYLMEDSGVFDGAYPGAGASLSSLGEDGFENQLGTFSIFEDFKKIPADAQVYGTYSNRGGLLTFVKKSDHRNIYSLGSTQNNSVKMLSKGAEKSMNESVKKILESFGIEVDENYKPDEIMGKLAEAWASIPSAELQTGLSIEETQKFHGIPVQEITEKLGKELSVDDVLKLAKEGQQYHESLVNEAVAMGVRAMGNDFDAETWKATLSAMDSKQILSVTKTFEAQAEAELPAGRKTNPDGLSKKQAALPDAAYKVGK